MKSAFENKLDEKLDRILKFQEENEKMFSFADACKYLCISSSTLYKLTSNGSIRFHKPNGKLIYFSQSQLNDWITGRKPLSKFKKNSKSFSR